MNAASFVLGSLVALGTSVVSVMAHCPLCTAATGAAVAAARFYGVPDGVVGVFIGAFAISTGLWLNAWLKKRKKEYVSMQGQIIVLASLILTLISLQIAGLFAGKLLFGLPSLLAGILLGSITSTLAYGLHAFLRHRANNSNLVPFQGFLAVLVSMVAGVLIVGFVG